ncbi:MAG TPA: DUF3828 domain-containing protein [Gammaproteobacteria bacterium]|nr:DUF3828 domain-containing protein [Gammaproteobacteria bacterium]
MNLRTVFLLAQILLISPLSFADDSTAAGAVVTRFYDKYLERRWIGLPSIKDQKEISPYLSRELSKLLNDARRYEQDYKRKRPDEKPPFVDGCLFASLFEGPQAFKIAQITAIPGGGWQVTVAFSYEDQKWRDIVVVKREGKRYVIDDVLLSGAGPFNPPGRLSETLKWRDNGG